MLEMVFDSFQKRQEGAPLQKAGGMAAERSVLVWRARLLLLDLTPDLPQREGWGMTALQKHLLSSAFRICQRVVSSCCRLPSMRHSKYEGLITLC